MPSEYDLWDMIPKKTDETWELAYYGGTFTSLPRSVMLRYLEFGQKLRREGRIGSIRISTHPAYLDQEKISLLRRYGVSTVELGVQSMDDFVLEKAGRDHGKGEIIHSITLLKDAGFTVGIQLMTGLPGQTPNSIFQGIRELLPIRPDMVRIYPLLVLEGTPLAEMWRHGIYEPQTLVDAVSLVGDMFAVFCHYGIPVIRMGLQPTEELNFDSNFLLDGPFHPSFGYLVKSYLKRKQMEMLLERHKGDVRFLASRNDLPLLFGDKRSNLMFFEQERRCAVSEAMLSRGDIALAPFDKRERSNVLSILREKEFFALYLERLPYWSELCI